MWKIRLKTFDDKFDQFRILWWYRKFSVPGEMSMFCNFQWNILQTRTLPGQRDKDSHRLDVGVFWEIAYQDTTSYLRNVNGYYLQFMTLWLGIYSAGMNILKINNRNTRTRCEICSKLTIKRHLNDAIDVALASLLTLKIFNTLLYYFYC